VTDNGLGEKETNGKESLNEDAENVDVATTVEI
jgi:hypothetical protein